MIEEVQGLLDSGVSLEFLMNLLNRNPNRRFGIGNTLEEGMPANL